MTTHPSTQSVIVKRQQEIRDVLTANAAQFKRMLPAVISPEQFLATSLAVLSDNPALIECTMSSLIKALLFCAQLGLVPGARGHVYLIPFAHQGRKDVQVIPSYQGLLTLARRSQQLRRINASVVLKGDFFHWSQEPPDLQHERNSSGWGTLGPAFDAQIVGAYAVAVLVNGEKQVVYWPVERLRAHRDRYSRSKDKGPWIEFFEQMCCKTVLRELCTLLPTEDTHTAQLVRLDKQAEAGERQSFDLNAPFLERLERADPTPTPSSEATSAPAATGPPAPEAPRQPPSPGPARFVIPFAPRGREHCRGKSLDDPAVRLEDLEYYQTHWRTCLANPARRQYREADEAAFQAVTAELERRRHGDGGTKLETV